MIKENYNFAYKIEEEGGFLIVKSVTYESAIDVPSMLVGFNTFDELLAGLDKAFTKEAIQNYLTKKEIEWKTSYTKASLLQLLQ